MVVSDIGAKLSPKAAPAKIATPNIVGLDPRNTPAGYITGTSDRTVPVLEPVPSANRQAAINATKVNTDPVAPAFVPNPVSYTHLRAHETRHDLVCRLLLEKKKHIIQ